MAGINSVRAEQSHKYSKLLNYIKKHKLLAARYRRGGVSSVIDLSAAKGYPTLLFAPHLYTIALETI
jgi:hypothetical protein